MNPRHPLDPGFNYALSHISSNAVIGEATTIGRYCLIEEDVVIGDRCTIGDYVKLLPGTVLGDDVQIDDYANSSGAVLVGNDVLVKRMACLTQGTIIEDHVFIGPGVMIIHEKAVSFARDVEKVSHGVYIREGAVIGGGALLNAGVTIDYNAVVGAGAVLTKDCEENGIYVGVPAARVGTVAPDSRAPIHHSEGRFFDAATRKRYLPHLESVGRWYP